jgi:hypothetical protein
MRLAPFIPSLAFILVIAASAAIAKPGKTDDQTKSAPLAFPQQDSECIVANSTPHPKAITVSLNKKPTRRFVIAGHSALIIGWKEAPNRHAADPVVLEFRVSKGTNRAAGLRVFAEILAADVVSVGVADGRNAALTLPRFHHPIRFANPTPVKSIRVAFDAS